MKNFYTSTKFITCYFLLMLWSLSLVGSVGCSTTVSNVPKEVMAVATYQSLGATLEETKPVILAMCADGTLSDADCATAKKAYNQAVTIYKTMSKSVDLAVDTGDESNFRSKIYQLQAVLAAINMVLYDR